MKDHVVERLSYATMLKGIKRRSRVIGKLYIYIDATDTYLVEFEATAKHYDGLA